MLGETGSRAIRTRTFKLTESHGPQTLWDTVKKFSAGHKKSRLQKLY